MFIIKKCKPNKQRARLYQLSLQEKEKMINVMIRQRGSEKIKAEMMALLQRAQEQSCWIECDCQSTHQPLLGIRKNKRRLSLFHINYRGLHAAHCPFREGKVTISTDQKVMTRQKRWLEKEVLALHAHLVDQIKPVTSVRTTKRQNSAKSVNSRLSKVGRALYTLVDRASLNVFALPPQALKTQYDALHSAASRQSLGCGLTLDQFLWTHPGAINQAIARVQAYDGPWLKKSRPYGVFIVVATQLKDDHIICQVSGKHYVIHLHQLKMSSGRLGARSAPYLVMFTVTNLPDCPTVYEAYEAFAVPVAAKNQLFPIESDYERRVLFTIKDQWLAYWQRKGFDVRVSKPLFDSDIQAADGTLTFVRPDFFVETSFGRIVLEVMGFNDEHYQQKKQSMVALMQLHWPVVTFQAYQAEKSSQWEKRLENALRGITKQLYQLRGAK